MSFFAKLLSNSGGAPDIERLSDEQNIQGLIKALGYGKDRAEDKDIRKNAYKALLALGPPAVDALIVALQDPKDVVRLYAATALGKIGDPGAVEYLTTVLNDDNSRVRSAAEKSLQQISERSSKDVADSLISYGAAVSLHDLARAGDLGVIRELIARCAADVTELDERGYTALVAAAESGHWAIVKYLIEQGADARGEDGYETLKQAVDAGASDMVQHLVMCGAPLHPGLGDETDTPLHYACQNGDLPVARFLIQEGAPVNWKTEKGSTPLHKAAEKGLLEIVQLLVENGADINAQDHYLTTPLMAAAYYGHAQVVRSLVKHGADIHTRALYGQTALSEADRQGQEEVVKVLRSAGAREE